MKKILAMAALAWTVAVSTAISYAATGVVDDTNILSPGTAHVISSREYDLKQSKGIDLTTVVIHDGKGSTMNSAAAGHAQSAPSIVLVIDTKSATAGWYPNGVTVSNPAGRISGEWLLQGKNTGNWDSAINAANQYAVGVARQAKIIGTTGSKQNYWLLFGAPFLVLGIGFVLILRLDKKRKKQARRVSTPLETTIAEPEVSDIVIGGANEMTVEKS